jgi:hypothetical protein
MEARLSLDETGRLAQSQPGEEGGGLVKRVIAGIVAVSLLLGGCSQSTSPSGLNSPTGCGATVSGPNAACAELGPTGVPGQASSGCAQQTAGLSPSPLAWASEPAPGDGLSQAAAVAAASRIAPPSSVAPVVVWAVAERYRHASGKGTISGDR